MTKTVFGQSVTAINVERLRADTGPTDFVRLCGALIGKALADRVGSLTLPQISERITAPDGGVDAEYTTPESLALPETGGLVGPGKTVFQFKYRDASATNRSAIVQKLVQKLREDFSRVAPRCDRYALLTNVHLSGAQARRLRDALVESYLPFSNKQMVIWGAAEIALHVTSDLRPLFLSEGGFRSPNLAESERKREGREEWIWDYRIRQADLEKMLEDADSPDRLWAIRRLLEDAPKERVLELLTPADILGALPKIGHLDQRTRQMWEAYARHWSSRH